MRPPSSIEPFTPSDAITLHPTLQAVLDNLDVQIEAELSRYRRQRRNPNAAPRRSVATQNPTAIGILKQNIQLPQPRSSIYATSANPANRPDAYQAAYSSVEQPPITQPVGQPVGQPEYQVAQSQPIQAWTAPPSAQPSVHSSTYSSTAVPAVPPVNFAAPVTPAPHQTTHNPNLAISTPVASPAPEPASIASYAEQYDLSAYAPDSVLQRLMQQLEPSAAESSATESAAYASQLATNLATGESYVDYLASSEELLRSIAEENSTRYAGQEPNSLLDTLLTPLGIGSMLLLLLSSTTLGYVVMNPSSIGLKTARQTPMPAPESQPVNRLTDTTRSTSSDAMPSPNLSAEEFLDLGLDTLSSIPKPAATPPKSTVKGVTSPSKQTVQTAPKSSKSSNSYSAPVHAESKTRSTALPIAAPELPPAPVVEPSLATVVVPAEQPAVELPKPTYHAAPKPVISPEPISVAPPASVPPISNSRAEAPRAAAPSPQPQSRYYVVTDYSGDPSLRSARGAVPDAYVRNISAEGAKVQLGAFDDEAKAEELRQELRQQGIEAEVYRP